MGLCILFKICFRLVRNGHTEVWSYQNSFQWQFHGGNMGKLPLTIMSLQVIPTQIAQKKMRRIFAKWPTEPDAVAFRQPLTGGFEGRTCAWGRSPRGFCLCCSPLSRRKGCFGWNWLRYLVTRLIWSIIIFTYIWQWKYSYEIFFRSVPEIQNQLVTVLYTIPKSSSRVSLSGRNYGTVAWIRERTTLKGDNNDRRQITNLGVYFNIESVQKLLNTSRTTWE